MKQNLLCMDWDGTLIDSCNSMISCIQATLEKMQRPAVSADDIRSMIGQSEASISAQYFPEDPLGQKTFWDIFRTIYVTKLTPALMPGAQDFLQRHQHCHIAIVTNKPSHILAQEILLLGLRDAFLATFTADIYLPKPHPMMLLQAMALQQHPPTMTWMIGDSLSDQEAALRASIPFIPVHAALWHDHSCTLDDITL